MGRPFPRTTGSNLPRGSYALRFINWTTASPKALAVAVRLSRKKASITPARERRKRSSPPPAPRATKFRRPSAETPDISTRKNGPRDAHDTKVMDTLAKTSTATGPFDGTKPSGTRSRPTSQKRSPFRSRGRSQESNKASAMGVGRVARPRRPLEPPSTQVDPLSRPAAPKLTSIRPVLLTRPSRP